MRSTTFAALLFFLVSGALFPALSARAESVLWSAVHPANLWLHPPPEWQPVIASPYMQVQYGARAFDTATGQNLCGASVAVGTRVTFQFAPHMMTDVYWSGTGFSLGTPYGGWAADGGYPVVGGTLAGTAPGPQNLCQVPYYYSTTNYPMYAAFSVAPPEQSAMIDAAFSCEPPAADGSAICTATNPGESDNTFVFKPTFGHFWWGYDDGGRHAGTPLCLQAQLHGSTDIADLFTQPVSQQSISCPITVVVNNETPSAPTVATSGAACVVGEPYTLTMMATDPHDDTLRYGVDWDANGTLDQFVPGNGYVPSGTAQVASRTYATPGTKTLKVLAQNSKGLTSGWTTVTFSCAASPEEAFAGLNEIDTYSAASGIDDNDAAEASLNLHVVPSLVRSGATTKVNWTTTNVKSCTVTAPNADFWDTALSAIGGETSRPITEETVYTLSCIDTDGATHTKTATVRIIPTFQEK